jgi:hypothetical protein
MKKILIGFAAAAIALAGLMPLIKHPTQAAGATLFITPATGDFQAGASFTAKVFVNSGGGSGINAAEGTIKFDPSKLKVSSVSKGSVFSLWTEEPSFSNSAGTIKFGGGSPSAYKGSSGNIININFSVLKSGDADLSFSSGLVLAMDGMGTNILSGYGNAKYALAEKPAAPATPETPTKPSTPTPPATSSGTKDPVPTKKDEEKGILPPAPEISSPTHAQPDIWYANNNPEFKWKLLADVLGVSISLTTSSSSDPGNDSDGIVEAKDFEKVKDGEWFVHVKFKNKFGWSQVAHRRLLVDVTPPDSFVIAADSQGDSTNPRPSLSFLTKDNMSGIEKYRINLNNEVKELSPNDLQGAFVPEALAPGEQSIEVVAYDKAGNAASSSLKFAVDPLKMPIISEMPKAVIKGKEDFILRGNSFYPGVTVEIYIAKSGKEESEVFTTTTDPDGNWAFFLPKQLEKGSYDVWTKIVDKRGAQSYSTAKVTVGVNPPSIIEAYGLWIIILLALGVACEGIFIYYLLKRFAEERNRIKRETSETKDTVSKVFHALSEELEEQLEFADTKRGLSESERRVKEKLQEALDVAQEFISKEIDDAEKEIKIAKKGK